MNILKTEQFVKKAREKFGVKFDYSKVIYTGVVNPVIIICPIHGEFKQKPNEHLRNKFGCGKCSKMNIIPLEELVKQSKKIHKNKYDYSKVKLIRKNKKVIIICPIHGDFNQSFENHINRRQGCPKCAGNTKDSKEDFVTKAKKTHRNKYDYSKVSYINNHTKVIITCPKHGDFLQIPANHINIKNGCPKCIGRNKTTEEFINEAKLIHGNKYDYSKTIYVKALEKVIITCLLHGDFIQTPSDHLNNNGCPRCKRSKGESFVSNFLEKNNINFIPQKTFKNCKYKKTLPFDFYLQDFNICIEYDGEFHFKQKRNFITKERLELQQLRDNIKTQYCIDNNISLIRIRYDENIEEFLKNKLIPLIK